MKNLGWQLFFALLLADIVGIVMTKLHVEPKITLIVGGVVFIILVAVMFFSGNARERAKKREQQANAKIAELQEQVDGSQKQG